MTATGPQPDRAEGAGRPGYAADPVHEELAGLLPPAVERDLPAGRHLHHRELLMKLIDDEGAGARAASAAADAADATAQPATGTAASADPAAGGRGRAGACFEGGRSGGAGSRRAWLPRPRRAVLVPATALALAAAVAVGLGVGAADSGAPATAVAGGGVGAVPAGRAAVLLEQISDAALRNGVGAVDDDQFVYVRSRIQNGDETSGRIVLGKPEDREIWYAQDPAPLKQLGVVREDGQTSRINAELSDGPHGTPAGIDRPTYRWLASLPTEPGALLHLLYAETPADGEGDHDQAVFDRIGDLVAERVMPPATAAALYRAAARIPGVSAAPEAVDGLGRRGIGIQRTDTKEATRSEWVFDRGSLLFLGSRSTLTKDTPLGRAGSLLSSDAVLRRAVVDRAGQEPTAGQTVESLPAGARTVGG